MKLLENDEERMEARKAIESAGCAVVGIDGARNGLQVRIKRGAFPPMNTNRYHYQLRATAPGRACVLAADVETVRQAIGGEAGTGCSVLSDRLISPREIYALQQRLEPGALIEVSDARVVELNAVAAAADVYRNWPVERAAAAGLVA